MRGTKQFARWVDDKIPLVRFAWIQGAEKPTGILSTLCGINAEARVFSADIVEETYGGVKAAVSF